MVADLDRKVNREKARDDDISKGINTVREIGESNDFSL